VDNLTAIVDRNGWQISGGTEQCLSLEPLAAKWEAFGWRVLAIDGHDLGQIRAALHAPPRPGTPTAVLARTRKARGVAHLEDTKDSHSATLDRATRDRALAALTASRGATR
jgi:transketolase